MNKRRATLALALAILFIIIAFMVILTTIKRRSGTSLSAGPEAAIRDTTASTARMT